MHADRYRLTLASCGRRKGRPGAHPNPLCGPRRQPRSLRPQARASLTAQRAATFRALERACRRCSKPRRARASSCGYSGPSSSPAPRNSCARRAIDPHPPDHPGDAAARRAPSLAMSSLGAAIRTARTTRCLDSQLLGCRSRCHGGLQMFHDHGPNLVRLLTRQRELPCRPHATDQCPERARRCHRCPLGGPSATHFSAQATTRSRVPRLLRRLGRHLERHPALDVLCGCLCGSLSAILFLYLVQRLVQLGLR